MRGRLKIVGAEYGLANGRVDLWREPRFWLKSIGWGAIAWAHASG
jgi:hypothetical protein